MGMQQDKPSRTQYKHQKVRTSVLYVAVSGFTYDIDEGLRLYSTHMELAMCTSEHFYIHMTRMKLGVTDMQDAR